MNLIRIEEPLYLEDKEGEFINPKFLRLTPGQIVPRIIVYSPNKGISVLSKKKGKRQE